uniref:protein-histidine N-methyltransferase n=1 Tax=Iconisemion striatum TaxID=60296 RepID=A0A1A7Z589_9TELE
MFEGSRDDYYSDLMTWAQENGASCDGFVVTNFGSEGYGLQATRDIKAEELFLWVPRKMLMTVESAQNSVLGPLHTHTHTPAVAPYSQSFLLGVPVRLPPPAYLHNEIPRSPSALLPQTHPAASKLPLKDSFTFDDYRWAVSSVMTRQNQIPTEDGSRVTLALIPLWDMCNHTNGLITTGYNLEDDRCECVALQDYKENEQIYIFYGTRSNTEFVIHNGFFYPDNAHDRVKIKLGVSKSERLYAMKAEVLARAGIPASCVFALHCNDSPIPAQLLAFLRVFCMSEEELKDYLLGDHAINKIFTLGNGEFPVSWENEIKLWTFLENRAALLLKTYKTKSEEDRSLLEKPDLSLHSRLAIQLRLAEKQILEKASASGRDKRLYFQKKLEDGASLPRFEESDISLLENNDTDSKLPIILGKLEEVEESGGVQVEEYLLNGEKASCGMGMEHSEDTVSRQDAGSEQKESADRTEIRPKEKRE